MSRRRIIKLPWLAGEAIGTLREMKKSAPTGFVIKGRQFNALVVEAVCKDKRRK